MLECIGYLSLEGKLSPDSLPQYSSAVFRYHELRLLKSPTKTSMVTALMKACSRYNDTSFKTSPFVWDVLPRYFGTFLTPDIKPHLTWT